MPNKKIDLHTLGIELLKESDNNPRGKVIRDEAFKDLVASIKEKGILVPLIVRLVDGKTYEVVTGHRRLNAAKVAGLAVVPCQVMKLNDEEAAEVAIIENLQRQDVHPIDEGEAYRKLHEEGGIALKDLAIRVGKDIRYVKQRMFLTNLNEDLRNQYRVGRFKDTHAILLARLSSNDQKLAFRALTQGGLSAPDLGDWIKEKLYAPLEHQPWLANPQANDAVGKCTVCPPNKDGLFLTASAGACIDTKCWGIKMGKYVEWLKAKEPTLAFISEEYGDTSKGVIPRGQYIVLKKKDACKSVHRAVVVEGPEIGEIKLICSDQDCKTHGYRQASHVLTPKEIAKRKKEAQMQRSRHESTEKAFIKAIHKVHSPISEKHLDVLLSLLTYRYSTAIFRPIAKRHEWVIEKKVENKGKKYERSYFDVEGALKREIKKMNVHQKAQLIAELIVESGYPDDSRRAQVAKML